MPFDFEVTIIYILGFFSYSVLEETGIKVAIEALVEGDIRSLPDDLVGE